MSAKSIVVAGQQQGYHLLLHEVDGLEFTRWVNGVEISVFVPAASLSVTEFVHVVGTFDGTMSRLYVNGELRASTPDSRPLVPNAQPLTLGCSSTQKVSFFSGALDELAIYEHALLETEIQSHYNAGIR